MAQQNTYSLSWFKKRTAEINKVLRTAQTRTKGRKWGTYRPTEEYKAYQRARAAGGTTEFVRAFGQDPRSAAGRAAYRSAESISINSEVRRVWAPLAAKNFYIANLMSNMGDQDVFVDAFGELWRRIWGAKKYTYVQILPMGRLGTNAIETPPPPLRQLTPQLANKLAAERAKKINQRRSGAHGAGGGGTPTESYEDE